MLPERVKGALDLLIVFPLLVSPSSANLFLDELPLPMTSNGVGGQVYWVLVFVSSCSGGSCFDFPFRSLLGCGCDWDCEIRFILDTWDACPKSSCDSTSLDTTRSWKEILGIGGDRDDREGGRKT